MMSADASKRETNRRQDGESGESGDRERSQTLGRVGVRLGLVDAFLCPDNLMGQAHKYFCSS